MSTENLSATIIVNLKATEGEAARFAVADIEQAITTMALPNGQPRNFEVRVLSIDVDEGDE